MQKKYKGKFVKLETEDYYLVSEFEEDKKIYKIDKE